MRGPGASVMRWARSVPTHDGIDSLECAGICGVVVGRRSNVALEVIPKALGDYGLVILIDAVHSHTAIMSRDGKGERRRENQ